MLGVTTTKYLLVDHLMNGKLAAFLAERREAGDSFDTIARDIWSRTSISVTGVTVSSWVTLAEQAAS